MLGESQPEEQEQERPEAAADSPVDEQSGSSAAEPVEESTAKAPSGEESQPAPPRQSRQRAPRAGRAAATAEGDRPAAPAQEPAPPPRLRETYHKEIVPAMMREFGFTNPMRVPRITKIVLNIGLGEALTNGRAMESATRDLTTIAGQKPVITRARKSIAGFKIREGNQIGTSVTLRGARMYHFLDRLVNTALPRIRDFRGIARRGMGGRGNFSIGIREQIIFPEIDYNQIDRIRGLQVTIATTSKNDAEALRLLEMYGMPFVREA